MISTMITLVTLFFSTLFPFSAPLASLAAQSDTDLEQKALAFIEQLAQGQYSEATAPFDEAMLKALPAERLQSIWANLLDTYGAYQSTGKIEVQPVGEHTAVNLIAVGLPALVKLLGNGGSLLSSALVFLIGICAVWAIFRLRDAKTEELASPQPEG